jgi:hypothetical protein
MEAGMLNKIAISLLLLFFASCSTLAPTPTDSGVEGQVFVGPMCPVVQEGEECPDQPYQADLMVTSSGGRVIVRFRTDEDGRFRVLLAPGDYILHPESQNAMPFAAEQPFTVLPGQFTQVVLTYDSGIR